jgi:hypothetical protein
VPYSILTKSSGGSKPLFAPCDMLFVEFGGLNKMFYGKDIAQTLEIIKKYHDKPVVFLCDDPDLLFPWNEIELPKTAFYWQNCLVNCDPQKPQKVKFCDFPFGSLLTLNPCIQYERMEIAYSGRPNGDRLKFFQELSKSPQSEFVKVYGRQSEWNDTGLRVSGDSPAQPQRQLFYRRRLACLGLGDQKHRDHGFRTGRVYHALSAGCPVTLKAGNDIFPAGVGDLSYWKSVGDLTDAFNYLKIQPNREKLVKDQQHYIKSEFSICQTTAKETGLL